MWSKATKGSTTCYLTQILKLVDGETRVVEELPHSLLPCELQMAWKGGGQKEVMDGQRSGAISIEWSVRGRVMNE